MDAVTSEISLVDRRRWRALHIFAHMKFLEVTIIKLDISRSKEYTKIMRVKGISEAKEYDRSYKG